MPTSERGDFENPKRAPIQSSATIRPWELEYMKKLERDKTVAKWTKNHGIAIQYVTEAGNVRGYHPDFLLVALTAQGASRNQRRTIPQIPIPFVSMKLPRTGAENEGCSSW